jgi:hypothetical protein
MIRRQRASVAGKSEPCARDDRHEAIELKQVLLMQIAVVFAVCSELEVMGSVCQFDGMMHG